jgi:hypothetical protein
MRKALIIALLLLIAIGIAYGVYRHTHRQDPNTLTLKEIWVRFFQEWLRLFPLSPLRAIQLVKLLELSRPEGLWFFANLPHTSLRSVFSNCAFCQELFFLQWIFI